MKKLVAYELRDHASKIIPAVAEREWMSETKLRFAYRCLPLTIANSMGWELLCPEAVTAEWNGGTAPEDIEVQTSDPAENKFALSHFGHGILTFRIPYLFRTEAGIGLWVRGSPNLPKDGIAPLEGIVETDWLTYTFTMNWKFTRPGRIAFAKDEPYCFVTPLNYHGLDGVEPEIRPIAEEPELEAAFKSYEMQRKDFIEGLVSGDQAAQRKGWQKWYMRGEHPSGEVGNPSHVSRLRLAAPRAFEQRHRSESTASAAVEPGESPEEERTD